MQLAVATSGHLTGGRLSRSWSPQIGFIPFYVNAVTHDQSPGVLWLPQNSVTATSGGSGVLSYEIRFRLIRRFPGIGEMASECARRNRRKVTGRTTPRGKRSRWPSKGRRNKHFPFGAPDCGRAKSGPDSKDVMRHRHCTPAGYNGLESRAEVLRYKLR
jgi:hypothetical protein